jgi:tRNA1Val (adenine37-N6)-methyltransferase
MRVSTDAVLLGAWIRAMDVSRVLDIGTGTGVLALMMAQRFPLAEIDAVELEEGACKDAAFNFQHSPWSNRLKLHHADFKDWALAQGRGPYDLILSNPPYFADSLRPASPIQRTARHQDVLPLDALVGSSMRLLGPGGCLALILPAHSEQALAACVHNYNAQVLRKMQVSGRPSANVSRMLWQIGPFSSVTNAVHPVIERMSIHEEKGSHYSGAYLQMTTAYYLSSFINQKGQV